MSGFFSKINRRINQSGDESSSSSAKAQDNTRRREQVRRAQRTHRERRAKYLQGLEAEVMSLRTRDAEISAKLQRVETMNDRLKAILQAHHIDLPPDLDDLGDPESALPGIGQASGNRYISPWPQLRAANPDSNIQIDIRDPQNAIDMILYLEQNCFDHIHQFRGEDDERGHSLQLQMSIMQTTAQVTEPWSKSRVATWSSLSTSRDQLEAQLTRLLETAQVLDLQGELTPVMCWSKMTEVLAGRALAIQQLDQLLAYLLLNMTCRGFGTVIDEEKFYVAVDEVTTT